MIGKGNNGGDALIACNQILEDFPGSRIKLLFACDPEKLKSTALRAYKLLKGNVTHYQIKAAMEKSAIQAILEREADECGFDLCIDGLLGMSFKPPLRKPMDRLIKVVNLFDRIKLRAAVDLPSGKGDVSDELFFRAEKSIV